MWSTAFGLTLLGSLVFSPIQAEKASIECTVYTISLSKYGTGATTSPIENFQYRCKTDNFKNYKVYGNIQAFLGSSYKSSQTTFTFPASIVSGNNVLDLDNEQVKSMISVSNPISKGSYRSQTRKQGTYKGLVIRVKDSTGSAPDDSETALSGIFFRKSINDGISVKSVFLGCSDNKFRLDPATGSAVNNGVITITLNYAVAGLDYHDVSDDVLSRIPSSGIDSYTYTMMVFPRSFDLDAAGIGEFPGDTTWYDNSYVKYTGLGVHELGHNLNMAHSGSDYNRNGVFDDDEEEYDDPTCPMGGEYGWLVRYGEKCFNAAKTFYTGWFSNYHGFATPKSSSFSGTLVGINDAVNDEISSGQYVTVKISDSGATDLFMMYNRVEGVTSFLENIYYRDKVVVVEQSEEDEQSWVKAVLDKGETYTESNWGGSGRALKIKVCDMTTGSPDMAKVGVWLNGVNSVSCVAAPTVSPAPTRQDKEILYVGNPCSESFPITGKCTECTGDCDEDSDCEGDMRCYQRSGGEDVPGCYFSEPLLKSSDEDFCYSPAKLDGIVQYVGECDSTSPCDRCQGDCDSDDDCADGLLCYQRDAFEAVPGCSGEGGTYDREAKDICYSTSPVAPPTAPTPTAPTPTPPTSNAGCVDSPFRFKVRKDGKIITRDCTWVSNRGTNSRCRLTGVKEHCPKTCSSCSTCVDSIARIQIFYNGRKITRDCAWVKNRNTIGRCRVTGMTETCRVTCGTC